MNMAGRIIFRIVAAVILVAVLVGAGAYVFNLGIAQGVMQGASLQAPAGGAAVAPVQPGVVAPFGYFPGPYGYRPFGFGGPFFGFGFLGCLIPLFFLFLVFGLFRMAFMPWRRFGMHGRGPWGGHGRHDWENNTPPMFDQWHRRAHGEPDKPTDSSPAETPAQN
jgi:hypothetical protein